MNFMAKWNHNAILSLWLWVNRIHIIALWMVTNRFQSRNGWNCESVKLNIINVLRKTPQIYSGLKINTGLDPNDTKWKLETTVRKSGKRKEEEKSKWKMSRLVSVFIVIVTFLLLWGNSSDTDMWASSAFKAKNNNKKKNKQKKNKLIIVWIMSNSSNIPQRNPNIIHFGTTQQKTTKTMCTQFHKITWKLELKLKRQTKCNSKYFLDFQNINGKRMEFEQRFRLIVLSSVRF